MIKLKKKINKKYFEMYISLTSLLIFKKLILNYKKSSSFFRKLVLTNFRCFKVKNVIFVIINREY